MRSLEERLEHSERSRMAAEQREHGLEMSLKEWKTLRIKVASIGHSVGTSPTGASASGASGGSGSGGSPYTPHSQRPSHVGSPQDGGDLPYQLESNPQTMMSPNKREYTRGLFSPDSLQGSAHDEEGQGLERREMEGHDRGEGKGQGAGPRSSPGLSPRGRGSGYGGEPARSPSTAGTSPRKADNSGRSLYSPTFAGEAQAIPPSHASARGSHTSAAGRPPATPPTPLFGDSGETQWGVVQRERTPTPLHTAPPHATQPDHYDPPGLR